MELLLLLLHDVVLVQGTAGTVLAGLWGCRVQGNACAAGFRV
jgi:hypothetical protein